MGETCIQRSRFLSSNQEIVQAVGTFKNGSLHGTAKLSLDDQTTIIANFRDGYFNGEIYSLILLGYHLIHIFNCFLFRVDEDMELQSKTDKHSVLG